MSKFSTVYEFDAPGKIWLKLDMNGSFFICGTSESSGCRLIVLNQSNNKDLCLKTEEISKVALQQQQGTVTLSMKNGEIKAIWFYDKSDLMMIFEFLKDKVTENGKMKPEAKPIQAPAQAQPQQSAGISSATKVQTQQPQTQASQTQQASQAPLPKEPAQQPPATQQPPQQTPAKPQPPIDPAIVQQTIKPQPVQQSQAAPKFIDSAVQEAVVRK